MSSHRKEILKSIGLKDQQTAFRSFGINIHHKSPRRPTPVQLDTEVPKGYCIWRDTPSGWYEESFLHY